MDITLAFTKNIVIILDSYCCALYSVGEGLEKQPFHFQLLH